MPRKQQPTSRNYAEADLLFAVMCDELRRIHPRIDENRLRQAFELSLAAHEGQIRKDGTPYIMHPLEVAEICVDLNMDEDSVICALLHDTVEDTIVRLHQIRQLFGHNVATMVDSLTKITKIDFLARFTGRDKASEQARNLQKLFVAMTRDTRVIVIKLADRLHNMQTLEAMAEHKQQRISLETLEFYIPIARRLGLGQMVTELEELVFQYLYPREFKELHQTMQPVFQQYERQIEQMIESVQEMLQAQGLMLERVYGRRKHLFSIFRKMNKLKLMPSEIQKSISDLLAIRVIIHGSALDCYQALGIIHQHYRPVFDRFRDFIASPKDNGYQTLHTTVISDEGMRVECQIRTVEMDYSATKGIASHWRYKESSSPTEHVIKDRAWVDFIRDLSRERVGSQEFIARTREEFLASQVLVLSPMGEVVSLPAGSTPIDFAYYIHTNLGHAIRQAKVNGSVVPLDYALQNGDMVEVIKGRDGDAEPQPGWLAMVKSSKSLLKLRRYYKQRSRNERIAAGQAVLRQYIVREGLYPLNLMANEKLAQLLRRMPVRSIDELYEKVALGYFQCNQIVDELKEIHLSRVERQEELAAVQDPQNGTEIALIGLASDLNVRQAGGQPLRRRAELMRCCTPVPGDKIYGVFDRDTRRVNVHRVSCPILQDELESGELLELAWQIDNSEIRYPARIEIVSLNRVGLLFEVLRTLSSRNINLGGAEFAMAPTVLGSDRYAHFQLVVEVADDAELAECLAELATLQDVRESKRLIKNAAGKDGKGG
ncbi:bifunctional (p)ppGpp synthetase/guanosine-3',5'-bis(diphosphate) 3'-pyrophosphohydrolase [bacterium]|nr:bifunctional (p)ppGpp synthetase/guanosine-3',5'-bis(diphosphate) 3'-pyrophosphohydrolase [bacterium]